MERIEKVLFVCMDGTCKSPMAEVILKYKLNSNNINICSRGITVLFPEPYNPKATAVLRNRGMLLDNETTKEVVAEDITINTLVLTFDKIEKERIMEKYDPRNLYTIKEFVGELGDMTDPYGKELEDYIVFELELEELIGKLVLRLCEINNENNENKEAFS